MSECVITPDPDYPRYFEYTGGGNILRPRSVRLSAAGADDYVTKLFQTRNVIDPKRSDAFTLNQARGEETVFYFLASYL